MAKTVKQSFSLDGSVLSFPLKSRFILMMDVFKMVCMIKQKYKLEYK